MSESYDAKKAFSIIVGQDEAKWAGETIAYSDIVSIYLKDGGASSTDYLIKYSQGPKENPSGTLSPGHEVRVKDGMHFRVSGTGES